MPITRTKECDLRSADYDFIIATAGGAIATGEVTIVEESIGFPLVDVVLNDKVTMIIRASQVRAMKAAEAIAAGDTIYWDAAANKVTKTSATGLPIVGVAVEAALLADATALITWDGANYAVVPAP